MKKISIAMFTYSMALSFTYSGKRKILANMTNSFGICDRYIFHHLWRDKQQYYCDVSFLFEKNILDVTFENRGDM